MSYSIKEKRERRITRTAFAGVLAASLVALPLGSVAAYADTTTGTITITEADSSQTSSYKAYALFKANAVSGNTITDVSWASTAAQTAVVNVITAEDSTYSGTTAQEAATFIANHIGDGTHTPSTDSTYILSSTSFGEKLAKACITGGVSASASFASGAASQDLANGYYLIVSDDTTVPQNVGKTY